MSNFAEMFIVTKTEATLDAATYVAQYRDAKRVQGYCAECRNYGKVWGCPPLASDGDDCVAGFGRIRLFGIKINFDQEMLKRTYSAEEIKKVIESALDEVWDDWLPKLYEMEAAHPGSRVFTGRCRLCRPLPCSRIEGKPCRHPDKLRHSLEAVGFDVVKSANELLGIELQWERDGHLPPYLTLVTAIFLP